ncbi:MAG: GNAT family N-acetyltransferase [Clostridia bacterium]|nr:GNAT family N-acetyltransferase [Clostridia bacterium]
MKFESKTVVLKDNRECILAPTTSQYAQEMIDFLKQVSSESEFLLRYPDEVNFTLEFEQQILDRIYEDEHSVMMLAIVDGKAVGNCSINGLGFKRKIRHRCTLAIAIKEEFCGLGIGTHMIEYLIELAKKIGFEIMELEYVDGNNKAKALYTKMGFVETGKRIKSMKYDDGTYKDEILMSKILNE